MHPPPHHGTSLTSLTNHSRRPSQLTDCQPMRERPQLAGKFKYPQLVSPAEFEAENNWSFNSCSAGWVTLLDNTISITISTLSGQLPLRYKSIQWIYNSQYEDKSQQEYSSLFQL